MVDNVRVNYVWKGGREVRNKEQKVAFVQKREVFAVGWPWQGGGLAAMATGASLKAACGAAEGQQRALTAHNPHRGLVQQVGVGLRRRGWGRRAAEGQAERALRRVQSAPRHQHKNKAQIFSIPQQGPALTVM
jgi:hypothetical protein